MEIGLSETRVTPPGDTPTAVGPAARWDLPPGGTVAFHVTRQEHTRRQAGGVSSSGEACRGTSTSR